MSPFDSWLCLRGLKTMALRVDAAAANAATLAAFLQSHPLVTSVAYPGLPSHPGAAIHASQASSSGALLSFTTGNVALSSAVVEATRLFNVAVSPSARSPPKSRSPATCRTPPSRPPTERRAACRTTWCASRRGWRGVGDLVRDFGGSVCCCCSICWSASSSARPGGRHPGGCGQPAGSRAGGEGGGAGGGAGAHAARRGGEVMERVCFFG